MEVVSFSFIDIFVTLVLACIMFGLGLSLTMQNFKNIWKFPRAFFWGLTVQMIALPLIAFLILEAFNLPDEFKVGLMILAACPGGTTSGFVTYFFRGNVALSISLTAVNSFLTLFSIPFIINLSVWHYLDTQVKFHLPVLNSILQIFFVTILPVILGLWIRKLKPHFSQNLEKRMKYILLVMLALVYSIKLFAPESNGGAGLLMSDIKVILPSALIFNIVCFFLGIFLGKLNRLSTRDAFTIAIEVSLHNTTLALLIGGTLLQNQQMVKPALIYAMFSFWTAICFGFFTRLVYKDQLDREEKSVILPEDNF